MEENQYLMWMKRKQELKSHILQAPFFEGNSSSWEERAFAEDAARILGGCIWPPRSYSCNFCKREFRSAQALGGHMNVHRRDRARLKQSLSPHHHHHIQNHHDNDEESSSLNHHHHHKNNNDCKSLGTDNQQFSAAAENKNCSQQIDICNFLVNPNCFSSNSISGTVITTSKISNQEEFFPHDNMSHIWGQNMMVSPGSEQKGIVVYASRESQISNKGLRSSCNHDCVVETSLSVGLNSVFGQKLPNDYSCVVEEDTSYKRPKTDSSISSNSLQSVFIKPCSNDNRCLNNFHHQSAEFVLGIKPGMEDLDLELRLGKPQKLKWYKKVQTEEEVCS